jgi:hypothetical protein
MALQLKFGWKIGGDKFDRLIITNVTGEYSGDNEGGFNNPLDLEANPQRNAFALVVTLKKITSKGEVFTECIVSPYSDSRLGLSYGDSIADDFEDTFVFELKGDSVYKINAYLIPVTQDVLVGIYYSTIDSTIIVIRLHGKN